MPFGKKLTGINWKTSNFRWTPPSGKGSGHSSHRSDAVCPCNQARDKQLLVRPTAPWEGNQPFLASDSPQSKLLDIHVTFTKYIYKKAFQERHPLYFKLKSVLQAPDGPIQRRNYSICEEYDKNKIKRCK